MSLGKVMRSCFNALLSVRERMFNRERIVFSVASLVSILLIFANTIALHLSFVGFVALIVYLFANGEILGKVFFSEEERFVRFGLGLFLFVVLTAFTGILALVIFPIEIWYLLGMIFATVATFLLSVVFGYSKSQNGQNERGRSSFSPIYGLYIVFFLFSLFVLLDTRSGWIRGPIWNVVPPIFLQTYFIATAFLTGIVLLPGKTNVKLSFIILHSVFSLSILLLILYPGIIFYDPWYEMGQARTILYMRCNWVPANIPSLGFIRTMNSLIRGLGHHALLVTFTEVLNVDMYWISVLLLPLLFGFFAPLTSYKITRMIGGSKETSLFAALLATASFFLLSWGKVTGGGSLGILFLFLLVYLLMRFLFLHENRAFLLAILVLATTATTHVLPGVISGCVVFLALALKVYEHEMQKSPRVAGIFLFTSFALATFLLPSLVVIRGILIPQIGTPTWNIQKLLATSIWELLSGVTGESPVYTEVLYNVFPVLGLVGIVYVMKRKERFNSTLGLFMSLAFGVVLIDFRILNYALEESLFGPARVHVFRDLFALPFVAIVVYTAANSLFDTASKVRSSFRWKNVLVGMLVCVGLSGWILGEVYENYELYTYGLLPTSLEVEVLEYIDEHTQSKYVVLAPNRMTAIGIGLFGLLNPEKTFVTLGAKKGLTVPYPFEPSLPFMFEQMRAAGAYVGYYIATSLWGEVGLEGRVAEASQVFRLWKEFRNENGVIYVFDYRIPPVPSIDAVNVTAFHWDVPPSYIIQNNLIRITINQNASTLAVMDFFGDLYERFELNKTSVAGYSIGNLTSIEYFDHTNNEWAKWDSSEEPSPALQFQFKLNFENDTLVGLIKGGEPSVDLTWESGRASTLSLHVGDFSSLYVPGLIGGEDSNDIISSEYGFFYTESLTEGVVLHPRFEPNATYSSLTYREISRDCNFTRTSGKTWYDLFLHNTADVDQWSYVEMWLPDEVDIGGPPLYFSVDDGATWISPTYDPETKASIPITSLGGRDVYWIFTIPRFYDYPKNEKPTKYWAYPYKDTERGGELPENYTDSAGAQNRILFGFNIPAGDKILVRVGVSNYWIDPLMVTFVFKDSEDDTYGLRNLKERSIKFYNLGSSEYVGGLEFSQLPTSLSITQDENRKIVSVLITLPSDTTLSLLGKKRIDTTLDTDGDGVPDLIE